MDAVDFSHLGMDDADESMLACYVFKFGVTHSASTIERIHILLLFI